MQATYQVKDSVGSIKTMVTFTSAEVVQNVTDVICADEHSKGTSIFSVRAGYTLEKVGEVV